MVDRINVLLKAKNITARQFAEEIGIQPSGMSHILSERNKPSLDFVMKVMTRWPEININWLMFGKGEMYVKGSELASPDENEDSNPSENAHPQVGEYDLFSQPELSVQKQPFQKLGNDDNFSHPQQVDNQLDTNTVPPVPSATDNGDQVAVNQQPTNDYQRPTVPNSSLDENRTDSAAKAPAPVERSLVKKKTVKVVVFYDDHTFAEYVPE